VHYS